MYNSTHSTWFRAVADSDCVISGWRWSLRSTACLVRVVLDAAPRVALHGALRERSWQLCSVLPNVNTNEPTRVRKISLYDLLGIYEKVLSCTRNPGVFARKRGNKDSRFAVVIELPVQRTFGSNSGLVRSNFSIDWLIWLDISNKLSGW